MNALRVETGNGSELLQGLFAMKDATACIGPVGHIRLGKTRFEPTDMNGHHVGHGSVGGLGYCHQLRDAAILILFTWPGTRRMADCQGQ